MSDWDLAAGVFKSQMEELVQTKLFIPLSVATNDVLEFIVATGRPVQQVLAYEDGFEITIPVALTQQGRVLSKATRYGMVIGGRAHYSAPVDELGATMEVSPQEVCSWSVAEINRWLADHEEELGIVDYEAILAAEEAGKNRASVVKGLKALIE